MSIENKPRDRYSRQERFNGIGKKGQYKLERSSAVIMGCGALGCNIANLLVRAGVGKVRVIDRDFIEYQNLQRQTLFTETDIKNRLPKAVAAKRHLQEINSSIDIEGIVADINFNNAERYCSGMDVILDGLDNLKTRYLINDVSQKLGIPYIYGGAIASLGMTMSVIPGVTPCFRCVFPNLLPDGTVPTCETEGILGPIASIISSLEATEALKILVGAEFANKDLITLDIWDILFERISIEKKHDCPSCNGSYEFLNKKTGLIKSPLRSQSGSIQVLYTESKGVVLEDLAGHLDSVQDLSYNEYMLQFGVDRYAVTVFPDGRAIISNTLDQSIAEELYLKYIAPYSR
ncbi:MAG: ThiF family adenylyltransferase [Dehalococcoidia bacterium]|nr:ThiF family adenylyltransferase [Dehalococcoidia bacterium]